MPPWPLTNRREFLQCSALAALGWPAGASAAGACPDCTVRIARLCVEAAPGRSILTTTYDEFGGPPLRLRAGRPVIVEVRNDTDRPECIHWHDRVASLADTAGSARVGSLPVASLSGASLSGASLSGASLSDAPTPVVSPAAGPSAAGWIPARARRRFAVTPSGSGLTYWHSDVICGGDLESGQYSGRMRTVLVEPKRDPGRFDREWLVVLKELEPYLRRTPGGLRVGYRVGTVNGRMLGHAEPLRARAGERALLHVLNASATETHSIALPGHSFRVQSLDGVAVPVAAVTPVLRLGPGERISALVELNHPGRWILGAVSDRARERGMGIVVEYADARVQRCGGGAPEWRAPSTDRWSYAWFADGDERNAVGHQDATRDVDMVLTRQTEVERGFARWSVDAAGMGQSQSGPPARIQAGRRYRFRLHNASDEPLTVQSPHQRLEIAAVHWRSGACRSPTPCGSGPRWREVRLSKDVVTIEPGQRIDADVIPLRAGPLLLRSLSPLQRDFGLLTLIDRA